MKGARLALTFALAAIAAIAILWFTSSFFVLEDQNPRGSLQAPAFASVGEVFAEGARLHG